MRHSELVLPAPVQEVDITVLGLLGDQLYRDAVAGEVLNAVAAEAVA
ncbi:MAG TPA: hypothetical protein VFA32_09425 [Dehalococcoidia bacterium]|nr:hypothetical protein [Dehalococcoidia bacterium]